MTPELYVASKIAQAIKQRYSNVTKQKTIIELLEKDQVEMSEGMLSRLFNGSYELKKDSRVFKELTSLLSPQLAPEDFWDYLVQDYSPDTEIPVLSHSAEQKTFLIGIPNLSILARPIITMLLNNKLPRNFEVVRQEIKQDNSLVKETSVEIPSKGGSPKEDDINGYFSGMLCEKLYDNKLQLIACPKQVAEGSRFRNSLMPLMKICSSASSQLVIFKYADNNNRGEANKEANISATAPPANQEKKRDTQKGTSRSLKDIFGKVFGQDGNSECQIKGEITYYSFLPDTIQIDEERFKYRKKFLDDLFSGDKSKFSVRTISRSVTESEWYSVYQKFVQDIQRGGDKAKVELLNIQEDKPINFGESGRERQKDYSTIGEKLIAGEKFLLCGFSPFNFKVIKGIIKELSEKDSDKLEGKILSIHRYNLSDMLDLQTDTYLYARKEQLEIKGNLIQFKEFMDAIRWVVDSEMMNQYETVKKLAYFYYGTEDEKKNHFYDSDVTKKLLDQYKKAFDEVHLDYKNNFYSKEFTEFLLDKYLQTS